MGFTPEADVSCEKDTCDFSDAYCHVLVHPEELKNCLVAAPPSPSRSDQNIALMCRMGFGSKGAPLARCRVAAALGRAAQAMLLGARWTGHAAGRINPYIDDPLLNLLGTQKAARQAATGRVNHLDRNGVQGRLGKRDEIQSGQVGRVRVRTRFYKPYGHHQDPKELLDAPMLRVEKLRRLAGKGGWIVNLFPKARWTIQRLWGATAEEERRRSSLEAGKARKHTRGGTHMPGRKASGRSSLKLDCCIFGRSRTQLLQSFRRDPSACRIRAGIRRVSVGLWEHPDNSSGKALQFFHEPLTAEDCARFNAKLGDAKGQQCWEALSLASNCWPLGCQVAGRSSKSEAIR